MARQLSIRIGGTAAAGKTTIAALIAKTLREHGINADIEDHDDDSVHAVNMTANQITERMKRLKDAGLEVQVSTIRTTREP